MTIGSSQADKAHPKKVQQKSHRDAPEQDASQPVRKQPDGSKVTTPPSDPANSEETLRRNKNGNS